MTRLKQLLSAEAIDLSAVAGHLDGLPHEERVRQVREVPGSQQRRLFEAVRGWRPLTQEHYVPSTQPDRKFVRHLGKNSLPVFSHFEKRFARPEPGSPVPRRPRSEAPSSEREKSFFGRHPPFVNCSLRS